MMDDAKDERVYRLIQTVVRRIRDDRAVVAAGQHSAKKGKR
jgi:hypothetical protein